MMAALPAGAVPQPGSPAAYLRDRLAERAGNGQDMSRALIWSKLAEVDQSENPAAMYDPVLLDALRALPQGAPCGSCERDLARLAMEGPDELRELAARDFAASLDARRQGSFPSIGLVAQPLRGPAQAKLMQQLAADKQRLQQPAYAALADTLADFDADAYANVVSHSYFDNDDEYVSGRRVLLGGYIANMQAQERIRRQARDLTREAFASGDADPSATVAAAMQPVLIRECAQLAYDGGSQSFPVLMAPGSAAKAQAQYGHRPLRPDRDLSKDFNLDTWTAFYTDVFHDGPAMTAGPDERFPNKLPLELDEFMSKKYNKPTVI